MSKLHKTIEPIFKAFDTETTGLHPYTGDRIFSYLVGDWACEDIQIFGYDSSPKARARLAQVFDGRYALICHNLKFDLAMVVVEGITVPETTILHDTMIMAKVLRNLWQDVGLDDLAIKLAGYKVAEDAEVKSMAAAYGGYHKVPAHIMREYQKHDGRRTMLLFRLFWPEICADTRLRADYENEIALIRVTQQMEQRGMQLDYAGANKLIDEATKRATTAEDAMASLAGEWFNPASGPQTARVLYEKFKLPILRLTGSKLPSVDAPTIALLKEHYPHPILDQLITYRTYSKMCGTVRGYFKLVDEAGRAHPNIKTNYAANTREACEKPNLQNVGKLDLLAGRDISERACWCAGAGCFLLFVDYAGIDMRLIIEVTGDPVLTQILMDDGDIHEIATELFYMGYRHPEGNLPITKATLPKPLWKAYRQRAKNAHFAKPYSARLPKIAGTLELTMEQAQPGYNEYCARFPKVAYFSEDVTKQAVENDYSIVSIFGRRLYLPPDEVHAAASYLISAGTAGIIKRAQVKAAKYIQQHLAGRMWPIVPVHDEVIFECSNDLRPWLPQLTRDMGKLMTSVDEVHVPLKVEWKVSDGSWEQGKEYTPPPGVTKHKRGALHAKT